MAIRCLSQIPSAHSILRPIVVRMLALLLGASLTGPLLAFGADPTGDGVIDVRDVQTCVGIILRTQPPRVTGAGDANGDGQVDASDVQRIVDEIVGRPGPLRLAGPTTLPPAPLHQVYSLWLPSVGGIGEHSWSYSGWLPPGFTFSSSGTLTGYPTGIGHYVIALTLTDSNGTSSPVVVNMTVMLPNGVPTPELMDDDYLLESGRILQVPGPGVLGNDSLAAQTAIPMLHSQALHGTVALAPDGGFSYLPMVGFVGEDSFCYSLWIGSQLHFGIARIQVHEPGRSHLTFVNGDVSGLAVRVGTPATLRIRVRHGGNSLPHFNQINSVTATTAGRPPTLLPYVGFSNPKVALFDGSLGTAGLAPGVHKIVATATTSGGTFTGTLWLTLYSGPAVEVGPGKPFTTIIDGVNAVRLQNGGVLLEPGVWTGMGNQSIDFSNVTIVGTHGPHRTKLLPTGTSIGPNFSGSGPNSVVTGLTLESGIQQALELGALAVATHCRVVGPTPPALGSAGGASITGVNTQLIKTSFRGCRKGGATQSDAYGGALTIQAAGAKIRECWFWANQVAAVSFSCGGAVHVTAFSLAWGGGAVLEDCMFSGNYALSNEESFGGAIAVMQDGSLDMVRCRVHDSHALSGTFPGLPGPVPQYSGIAKGGGIGVRDSSLRLHDVLVHGCHASAEHLASGGGVCVHSSTCLFNQLSIDDCHVSSDLLVTGGGLSVLGHNHPTPIRAAVSSVYLTDTDISHCSAASTQPLIYGHPTESGGGMHVEGCYLVALRLRVTGCNCTNGAGASFGYKSATQLDQCIIYANGVGTTTGLGGGACLHIGSYLVAEHCVFSGNATGALNPLTQTLEWNGIGSAICQLKSGPSTEGVIMTGSTGVARLHNCLFDGNGATGTSGTIGAADAIPEYGPPSLAFHNCTFANNAGTSGSVFSANLNPFAISNSIIWGNLGDPVANGVVLNATNCLYQGPGLPWGTGNSSLNPEFASGPQGNYYLSPTSPALGAGTAIGLPAGLLTGLTVLPSEAPAATATPSLGFHRVPISSVSGSRSTNTLSDMLSQVPYMLPAAPPPPPIATP